MFAVSPASTAMPAGRRRSTAGPWCVQLAPLLSAQVMLRRAAQGWHGVEADANIPTYPLCAYRAILCCSWSAISRRERYLKRCTEAGDELPPDADQNLLPGELVLTAQAGLPVDAFSAGDSCTDSPCVQLSMDAGCVCCAALYRARTQCCGDCCAVFACYTVSCTWCLDHTGVLDPVTLEPVVNPAMSPAGDPLTQAACCYLVLVGRSNWQHAASACQCLEHSTAELAATVCACVWRCRL